MRVIGCSRYMGEAVAIIGTEAVMVVVREVIILIGDVPLLGWESSLMIPTSCTNPTIVCTWTKHRVYFTNYIF